MKTRRIILILGLCLASSATFAAKDVEFNYEGRVLVDEIPYTGDGHFKFAILLGSGDKTVWSNDGTSDDGSEPASAVVVSVTEGVFNVIIGDTSIYNMEALSPSIFNNKKDYYLRVWFSDSGDAETFEHLAPDRRITDAGVLGLQSDSETDIYVDPVLGDDDNNGQREDKAKKTIQAAWDALPTLLNENAVIHLAEGTYREEVLLSAKEVGKNALVTILGNVDNPDLVRVSGADEAEPTVPVRDYGFHALKQTGICVRGVLFEFSRHDWEEAYYASGVNKGAGFYLENGSSALVEKCKFVNNNVGLCASWDSYVEAVDTEFGGGITGNYPRGIDVNKNSRAMIRGCHVHHVHYGISSNMSSYVEISDTDVDNCTTACCAAVYSSTIMFYPPVSNISNTPLGVSSAYHSTVIRANDPTRVEFIGSGIDTIDRGGGGFYE